MIESKLTHVGYELSEVNLVQADISFINHRAECNPYLRFEGMDKDFYPVIVSPMGAVTNEKNYKKWLDEGFMCVVPRTVDIGYRLETMYEVFTSFSLNEAESILTENVDKNRISYICIDLAQGTMNRLYEVCKRLKNMYGEQMIIMTGNVANPDAYYYYADAGIDYLRASVGTGSRCTTSCNVSVHYPTATLLDELRIAKDRWESTHDKKGPKIIMDGGISNFDDIQKCLALGADMVMSGSIFAKSWEACGEIFYLQPNNLNMNDAIPMESFVDKTNRLSENLMEMYKDYDRFKYDIAEVKEALTKLEKRMPYREYYGMSTKRAQRETGGNGTTTAEGISRPIPIEYNINKWADNMKSFLVSAMSYTNSKNLKEFAENTELIINLSGDKSYRK